MVRSCIRNVHETQPALDGTAMNQASDRWWWLGRTTAAYGLAAGVQLATTQPSRRHLRPYSLPREYVRYHTPGPYNRPWSFKPASAGEFYAARAQQFRALCNEARKMTVWWWMPQRRNRMCCRGTHTQCLNDKSVSEGGVAVVICSAARSAPAGYARLFCAARREQPPPNGSVIASGEWRSCRPVATPDACFVACVLPVRPGRRGSLLRLGSVNASTTARQQCER